MRKSKSGIYIEASVNSVTSYIRGELNLEEAVERLDQLGHNKKSAIKVLKDTHRNNVFSFQTKSRLGADPSEQDVGDEQTG